MEERGREREREREEGGGERDREGERRIEEKESGMQGGRQWKNVHIQYTKA